MNKSPDMTLSDWLKDSDDNLIAFSELVSFRKSNREIAKLLNTSETSIRRSIQKYDLLAQDMKSDLLSTSEAAEYLGITIKAIRKRVERDTLASTKLHGRRFFRREDLVSDTEDTERPVVDYSPRFKAQASITIKGDTASGTTPPIEGPPSESLNNPDEMMRLRGLDPEEWVIDTLTINEWEGSSAKSSSNGGEIVTFHQCKFTCKRKISTQPLIIAPRSDGWRAPQKASLDHEGSVMWVVLGDQQAPFQDPGLHKCTLQFLSVHQPREMISLGDSYDFPDISRHPLDPINNAKVNECLQSGYDMFRGYVDASPNTRIRKLLGNHDERFDQYLINKNSTALLGVSRPATDTEPAQPVLDLSHVGRLDELGVEVVRPNGGYQLGQIRISDKLAVRHGWIAKKGAGASALATLDHLGHSVIVGHTHRQSVVHQTKHEISHAIQTRVGVEAGCMCRVSQAVDSDGRVWPSYSSAPDWTQGFCTVEVWPDGTFHVDLATFANNALLWRGERYTV